MCKRLLGLLLALVVLPGINFGKTVECPPGCSPGRFSSAATDLSWERVRAPATDRDIITYSPDRHSVLRVVNDRWWVEIEGKKIKPPRKSSEIYYPAEWAWAPDNKTFFITSSFGETTGYRMKIYRIDRGRIRMISNPTNRIIAAFNVAHKCEYIVDGEDYGNDPNVAGLVWLEGSRQILVVAEVPNLGICKQMYYFGGFLLTVPSGQILQRFSTLELIDRWGKDLGWRLEGDLHYLRPAEKTMKP